MHKLPTLMLIFLALTAGNQGFAAFTEGAEMKENSPPEMSVMQSNGLTLSQAIEQVRRQYNGRIVGAETRVSGGRETHIIKVLTNDGTVKTVRIPGCPV